MLGLLAMAPGAWADDASVQTAQAGAGGQQWADKVQARDDRNDDGPQKFNRSPEKSHNQDRQGDDSRPG